jgi:hypothetical protein
MATPPQQETKTRLTEARELIEPLMKAMPVNRLREKLEREHFLGHGPGSPPWWSIPSFDGLKPYVQFAFVAYESGVVQEASPHGQAIKRVWRDASRMLENTGWGEHPRYSIPIDAELRERYERTSGEREFLQADALRRVPGESGYG